MKSKRENYANPSELSSISVISSKDFYSVYTDYHVLAGSTNILLDSDSKYFKRQDNDVMFEIASLKTHPDYDPENDDNDISILKLLTDLNFSDSIQAINIPDTNFQIQTSDVVYVCGWGQTKVSEFIALVLRFHPIWITIFLPGERY